LKNTCLIAEADPFLARLLERYAEESGLQTVRATVGQEVVSLAEKNKPLVIIIDAELPGKLRGWQALQELASCPALMSVPIITCCWISRQEASVLVPWAVDHLHKPDILYSDFISALKNAGISPCGAISLSE
jgi:DNA-binding response OmpR family regulator